MSIHRYPPASLYADYARAAVGVLLTATPLAFVSLSPWVAVPLAACLTLFLAFALKAFLRQRSSIELTDDSVVLHGPFSRTIRWPDVSGLKLSYYATRRERGSGWMQLALLAGKTKITAESSLEGFDQLAERAAEAARQNGVKLDDRTVLNLEALGLDAGSEPDPDAASESADSAPWRS